jgi:uncharacterized protein
MEQTINFNNSKGDKLLGILSDNGNKDFVLVMVHGFSSNKNTKNFVKLSQILSGKNIASLRIDIWGHGESDGDFAQITVSEAVDDILQAIKYVKGQGYKKIGLLGSSFGGISGIIAASKTKDLVLLALKSPVSDYMELEKGKYTQDQLDEWKSIGYREYEDDGKVMKLNWTFVADFANNNAFEAAKSIKIPTLIVHGNTDDDVPYTQSQKLITFLPNANLVTIQGANHRYAEGDHAEQMLKAIFDFVIENK